ncbi:non-ribosomal peptide synthetase [Penicillium chermesinum]|uniref:Non-ribosomal peptide synthetase n=1 Tax=Penicillium chermesinum TaxID=63820 RepID=A0A9W9NK90_9EURO|nr:non-ribosomal peptide synthetase [Penicillium chermesinum]KAJ5220193.1 non-ribosomal peptide synthetase [Penicillium chermesinum]KAJ6157637.1 non-ribosomal peptide synthetase [Penicillium chermesinum]
MSPSLSAPPVKPQSRLNAILNDLAQQCKISPEQIQDVYPCTPLQQGLTTLSETSSGAYMAQHVYTLQKDVDQERMAHAWNAVVQRHQILRTRILLIGENAMQVVLKREVDQWGDCSDLHAYLSADQATPLQIGQRLSRLAISKSHLVWSAHHSIYDGFSVELILQDVATAYYDRELPPRPSFRHFIERTFQKTKKEQTEVFWKSKLGHIEKISAFPRLPSSSYRPKPNSIYQHEATLSIDGPSSVTMSAIANAAWALVQSSHLGNARTTFGTTLSGRNTNVTDIEKVVGPTLATVPVCLDTRRNLAVKDYLQATQSYFTEMIPHQHIGLQNLKKLSPAIAEICDFQTLFAFQPAGTSDSQRPYGDLLLVETKSDVDASFYNYALTVQCSLGRSGAFKLLVAYDNTVISEVAIERLTLQFEHIVSQLMTSNGSEKLKDIDLVSPHDLKQLNEWHSKAVKYPEPQPLDAFSHHVVSAPYATAISSWDGDLSYEKLDVLASRLAGWLIQARAVVPETVVPICFDRSQWMIVSILAVMKAGGAFLLLDPIYPEERLKYMIEMANSTTILVSESCKRKFQTFNGLIQAVDSSWLETNTDATTVLPREREMPADRAMYLIFTSGSTGQPKGVVITHRSYGVSAAGHIPALGLDSATRQLFFASPAFDLTIYETVSSLMAGSTICIPSEEDRNGSVAPIIRKMDVNMISLTSSYARHLVPEDVPSLKTLALVGEPLARDVQRVWADKICLVNAYGPTECSVVATLKRLVTLDSNTANIGPPTTGRAWIVDPNDVNSMLPIGATGEMLIEGGHLGRGYLNDPEKTASSFVFNPRWATRTQSSEPRRFYKTGDLVRFDEDGSLVIDGRKDTQVKIRGQRVEIAEIEYHMTKLFDKAAGTGVEACRHDDQVQLVAFLFCAEGAWDGSVGADKVLQQLSSAAISSVSDIKMYLEKLLPFHMVPTRYQIWPKMPLMASGKLDRKALLAEIRSPSRGVLELDETDVEFPVIRETNEVALKLNQQILSLTSGEKIASLEGRDFPLSILGLDSIQLIRLVTFIRKEYGTKMVVGVLYDLKLTVTRLGALITASQSDKNENPRGPALDLSKELQSVCRELTRRSESAKHKRRVFLTGATGLLGSQILRQLLTDPHVQKVIIHVRATSAAKGLARVVAAATLAKWWSPSYTDRIECWPGDLKEPQLGLHPDHWRILCGTSGTESRVTSIIHNGAAVQWQAPYQALKAANVDSTVDLLTAASQWSEPGSFTFVSGGLKRSPEEDFDTFLRSLEQANGYSQSKFIAEELVSRFGSHQSLHRVSIVRPGWVIGTAQEAVPNTDDFLWTLVQACIQIGSYPAEGGDLWLAVADVEEVSTRVLATTFAASGDSPSIENVENGTTVSHFWELIKEQTGKELKAISNESWKEAAQNFVRDGRSGQDQFLPILAMLQDPQMSFGVKQPSQITSIKQVDGALKSNIQSLVDAGFFSGAETFSPNASKLFSRSRVNKSSPDYV